MLEAMIGYMKNDGLLDKYHLKGKLGDSIHAILCGVGHNLRLLYNFWTAKLLKLLFSLLGAVLNWCIEFQRNVCSYHVI